MEKLFTFLNSITPNERIALISSGGTLINLDIEQNIKIENYSKGLRGAICAEELLKNNYFVIFLYREDSYKPFTHNIKCEDLYNNCIIEEEKVVFMNQYEKHIMTNKLLYDKYKSHLIDISFSNVNDYLSKRNEILKALSPFGERILVLLAAFDNYFISQKKLTVCNTLENKESLEITINLSQVENQIAKIKKELCKTCLLIVFQQNDEEASLTSESKRLIQEDKVDYIVTSWDEFQHNKLVLMNLHEKFVIYREELSFVENKIIRIIVSLHNINIHKWEYYN
jgi:hypothetical protein